MRWGLRIWGAVLVAAAFAGPAQADSGLGTLYSPQANELDTYDLSTEPPAFSQFKPAAADGGRDLNAQVCGLPGGRQILLGEDSNQTLGVPQGWGIFDLETKKQLGKVIADYAGTPQPENYGCAIEKNGSGQISRIFVGQVGDGSFTANDGQVIIFFPSSPSLDGALGRRDPEEVCPGGNCEHLTKADSDYCIIDGAINTAGGMALGPDGSLYVAQTAPALSDLQLTGRILRYRPPFPTSPADCHAMQPEVFMENVLAATPGAIAAARNPDGTPNGHWYVSSTLFPQAVTEHDSHGKFVRFVMPPLFYGTPFGLAVDRKGTLYIADLGVGIDLAGALSKPQTLGIGPIDRQGSILRVRFGANGKPLNPEVLRGGLTFPDGLGIIEP